MGQLTLKSLFTSLSFTILISSSFGQYSFDSKKAEKQYFKFDDAYMDYDYDKLFEMEQDILALFSDKEDTVIANVYSFLGEAYVYGTDDIQKGLDFYEKEYKLREKIQPDEPKSDLAYNLAAAYDLAGQYGKSEELYLTVLDEERASKGRKSEDYVLTVQALADHYTLTGEAAKGLQLIRQNKRSVERKSFDEALMMKYEGDFLEMNGQYNKSEDVLIESLSLMDENGYYPSLEYAYTLNALGTVYTNAGRFNEAMKVFESAMDVLERLGTDDEEGIAGTQFNLARVYKSLALNDEALKLYDLIKQSDADYYGEESVPYARTIAELAEVYLNEGDLFKAEEQLLRSLEILTSIGEENTLIGFIFQGQLADVYIKMEMFDEAEEYALASKKGFEDNGLEGYQSYPRMIGNLAKLYMKSGDKEKANEYALMSVEAYENLLGKKHPLYALATRRMAIASWGDADLDKALNYYNETFDNYFAQINAYFPILSEDEKAKFYYNKLKPTFEQFNSFVIENRSEDPELLSKMYNYQLATKGLIFYATNKVRESILNSGDTTLIQKYEGWIAQKETLAQLFSSGELKPEERNAKIDSVNALANEMERELSEASSLFATNFASQDLTWEDIRDQLQPGEAAVEIVRFRDFDPLNGGSYTDEVYYAGLIVKHDTQEAPELVIMRNGLQMETKYLSNYRNAIKYQMNEVYSYRLFWRPMDNKLEGINKIYFSPDGVYNQISIYTLQNPASKQFTIDEFEFQLVTNTKDLLSKNTGNRSNTGQSYLFGYPNYNLGGQQAEDNEEGGGEQRSLGRGMSRGARGGSKSELDELTKASLPRGVRGTLLRYMGSGAGMPLLPGTLKEVNLIDSLYANQSVDTEKIMDDMAVEDRIKEVNNPRTLHIATHGFFLEEEEGDDEDEDKHVTNPMLRSGLIMAGANSYIREGEIATDVELNDDGILTAYEAMNLNLDDTELVILSACETGLGEVQNGEGVFGLQRAFKVAGTDALIMSMWTVDDAATQELMTIFYEEWLGGKSKKDAFNMAQKRLKDKWKKPYYWGAFVMVGE
jgi:CHAT domain-containing protein